MNKTVKHVIKKIFDSLRLWGIASFCATPVKPNMLSDKWKVRFAMVHIKAGKPLRAELIVESLLENGALSRKRALIFIKSLTSLKRYKHARTFISRYLQSNWFMIDKSKPNKILGEKNNITLITFLKLSFKLDDFETAKTRLFNNLKYIKDNQVNKLMASCFLVLCDKKELNKAYQFKKEAAEKITDMPVRKKTFGNYFIRTMAAFYLEDMALSNYFLARASDLAHKESERLKIIQWQAYLKLLSGEDAKSSFRWLLDAEFGEGFSKVSASNATALKAFSDLIQDKRVCIVGPANTGLMNGGKIDDYDVVIRLNAFSFEKLEINKSTHGSRVDVSYYNSPITKANMFGEVIKFINEAEFFPVFRSHKNKSNNSGIKSNYKYMSSLLYTFASRFKMHGIQRAVWDVLKFNPKVLDIYNIDFFTGIKSNSDSLRVEGYVTSGGDLGYSHDLLQGFRFTRYLNQHNIIGLDDVGLEVVNWSDEEYLAQIEFMINTKYEKVRNKNRLK